jgi:uncharacterized protein (DUF433 family)
MIIERPRIASISGEAGEREFAYNNGGARYSFTEGEAMPGTIAIVDHGRGPQLSTSRITVQDLVPYLERNFSYKQIVEIMPVLTVEEIQVVERYVQEHYAEVMEQDRRIRERNAQRIIPPEIAEIRREGHAKLLTLKEQFAKKKNLEANGDQPAR